MNKRVKKLWVDALRSGKYQKAKGSLRDHGRYCCLGVLTKVYAEEHGDSNDLWFDFPERRQGKLLALSKKVMEWAELDSQNPDSDENADIFTDSPTSRKLTLAEFNDMKVKLKMNEPKWVRGYSFKDIADIIERAL